MKKIVFFEILFTVLLVLTVGLLVLRNRVKDVTVSEVEQAFTARADFSVMEKFGDMRLRRNLSLESSDYEEYVYYAQSDTMAVQVFFFAKCPSKAVVDQTEKALKIYVRDRIRDFEGYGASQTAMLKDARIYRNEHYVGLIVSANADGWESALRSLTESAPLTDLWNAVVRLFRKEG